MSTPREEYTRRQESRAEFAAACDRQRLAWGMGRLVLSIAGVAMAIMAFRNGWLTPLLLLIPLALFFWIGSVIQSYEEQSARWLRAVRWYERGLRRLDGHWAGEGSTGERFLNDQHLYARDLDIFGEASVFELLSRARTRMGERALARWLTEPAPADEIDTRIAAIEELEGNLDLREGVAIIGAMEGVGVHPDELAAWAEAPPHVGPSLLRTLAPVLAVFGAATLVALVLYIAAVSAEIAMPDYAHPLIRVWFFSALLAFGVGGYRFGKIAEPVFNAADIAARDVDLLAGVLERIEAESFECPRLQQLRAALDADGVPPSRHIAVLRRLMDRVQQRDNPLVRFIGPFVMWDVRLVGALEDWRATCGKALPRWLDAVGDIEALGSIASYHYENADCRFASFVDGGATVRGVDLEHPLLPRGTAVANSVTLGGDGVSVLIVSGSNMSGKSTLLRTVGTNVVLAQAGVPLRAASLELSSLAVGASIRLNDSLKDGESRFYAEILRLRQIVDAADGGASGASPPCLFLIDEFLNGTNSHDRRIGAGAIVRGLVERSAIGLVTTHDLALTHIAEDLDERGANVHFEDHLEDGKMAFDYRMRDGVVEKSNALELMRSVGLDV